VRKGAIAVVLVAAAIAVTGVPATASGASVPAIASGANVPAIAQDTLPVRITLDQLTPAIPLASDTLRVSGTLLSSGLESLTDVTVQLRRSRTAITTRTDLESALNASTEATEPDVVVIPGSAVTLTERVSPGRTVSFSISVPMASLRLTGPGAWILGIEVVASRAGSPTRLGEQRTVIPYFPLSPTPIEITWLWPLVGWPDRTANGTLLTNQTPTEVSPDGRLGNALTAVGKSSRSVSWVVDPALEQTVAEMTNGYQVVVNGSPTVGDRQEQAAAWLATLAKLTTDLPIHNLPYAAVDASALVRGGLTSDVVRAVTEGPRVMAESTGVTSAGALAWGPYGRLDIDAADVLATSGVSAIVLPADALPSTDPASGATTAIQTPHGSLTGVLVDPRLSLLTDPGTPVDPILLRQEFLADTALIAAGMSPLRSDRGVVVGPRSVTWNPQPPALTPLIQALSTTPWLHSRSLEGLLDARPDGAIRGRAPYGSRARQAELSTTYIARLARTGTQLSALTAVVDDPAPLADPYRQALLRASSATWRTEPDIGSALLATTTKAVAAQIADVHVLSAGTVTLSGDAGRVPVTISNDSNRDVVVGLALRGNPAIRLRSTVLTGIRIAAGQKASVDVTAQVIGADAVPVDVQLLTPQGEDYGAAARISVTSTAYARAASWVMIAAFAAILIFVVVGVTRRIRAAGRAGRK
jgi:hypothetical protein